MVLVPFGIHNSTLSSDFEHFAKVLVDVDLSGSFLDYLMFEIENSCEIFSVTCEFFLEFFVVVTL